MLKKTDSCQTTFCLWSIGISVMLLVAGCSGDKKKVAINDFSSLNINNDVANIFDAIPSEFESVSPFLFRKPIEATAATESETLFTKVSDSGIKYKNTHDRINSNLYLETGSGVAIGDFDNDGRKDIYLTGTNIDNRLFRNVGGFKFEDVTDAAGVDGRINGANVQSAGASFADIDNDGDLDLYVCNMGARNLLYINQNDGTFLEQANSRSASYLGASKQASFCDYDRDGDLDFYLVTYQDEIFKDPVVRMPDGKLALKKGAEEYAQVINEHKEKAGELDLFFRNEGDGTFKNIRDEVGIHGYDANLACVWIDYDDDGWQDLYVGSDFKQADHLYKNNRDGTFTDVLGDSVRRTSWFSMGMDAGDLNNDGLLDLIVGDMADPDHYGQKVNMGDMSVSGWFLTWGHPRQFMQNCVFINAGNGRLMEHAAITGLAKTDWTWSIRTVDLDNDGMLDVFFTNGHSRDNMNADLPEQLKKLRTQGKEKEFEFVMQMPRRNDTNMVFRNEGNLKFASKGSEWGLDHTGISHAASFADLDGDGDLDAIVNNYHENALIYRNDSNAGGRLLVQLRCKDNNYFGIGSKIEVWQGDQYQRRDLIPGRGYLGSDPMELHFGVNPDAKIDRLKITWPDATTQEYSNLDTNFVYRVIESSERNSASPAEVTKPMFASLNDAMGVDVQHSENEYNDFEREPLLPYQLSRLGGSVATGDVNGDGFPDAFCGGAAGQPGTLLINQNGSSFQRSTGPWESHASSEDMGLLFFDADQDGDLDLYVVSGGNEFDVDSALYRDRLYLNDGTGKFEHSTDALPELFDSGSCVAAADFDRDGDLDLFVGSRSIPGQYPLTPVSRLLINEGGNFSEASDDAASGLASKGMVNSAIWSDFDGDGWTDLIVAIEWGPVAFFKNREGKLFDVTGDTGVEGNLGWWHGIAAGDLDADGDIDYVVTNQGTNTKYHTSAEHPHRLYYEDFDGSGTLDLVEAEYEGETEYPVRGRSCSSRCMPFIAEKFGTFHDFSKASLSDIYEIDKGKKRFHEVTTLESVVLWNDGEGFFDAEPLGYLAQSSPAYGVAVVDVDGDSNLDILLANNFFGSQPETNYMDGGLCLLVRGNGDKTFDEVWPDKSGLSISGDSNGLAIADFDRDGKMDAMIAVNNEPLEVLGNQTGTKPGVVIELIGSPENRFAVGAQVIVESDSDKQAFELSSGGSYLSSSVANEVSIGATQFEKLKKVTVRWPDGKRTVKEPSDIQDGMLRIEYESQ